MLALTASLSLPHWLAALPAEALLPMVPAAFLAALASLGPAEPPPPEEVTAAAIFALHGHV
ncbi:hypothetical protein E2C06_10955 [Dankookia rubra]|uniref:Uncharacterized protein n=1 Tax=Dankookia rubra TaxID=1442381 RepID=A0A4R5QH53_9PROT|nr:hypothetical protein [Dankookia rubra]TDH62644.1 hypothetical protein E2C06_10955 [Dankookia rubra]